MGTSGPILQILIRKCKMDLVYQLTLLCLLHSAKPVCSCLHNYTTQPPADLVCNPYTNRRLQLECGVTGTNLHQIQWYFSPYTIEDIDDEDPMAITNNSKYFLSSHSSKGQLVLSLTVNDLNENTDTGTYWCQAFLLDGTMLVRSNPLQLENSESYYPDFACSNNNTLKNSNSVCAPPIATGTSVVSPPIFVSTNEPFGTTGHYLATTPPPAFNQLFILYIAIGSVGICSLMCFVLLLTVCIMRKKAGSKEMEQNMELGKMSNQTAVLKRPDLPQLPLDTSDKSIEGDYAEIGPELMNSMQLHSIVNSHYSEIADIVLQPPHTLVDESEGKENPYDELDCLVEPCSHKDNSILFNSYSKLERVPQVHVTPYLETGFTSNNAATMKTANSVTAASAATMETWYSNSGSNSSAMDTTKEWDCTIKHHSLENLHISAPWLRESLPLSNCDGNSDYTNFFIFPKMPHLPAVLEHPYHILEQSGSLFGSDSSAYKYSPNSCDYMEKSDVGEYDRLVDPLFYKCLDQSVSKIYDVKSGPYSRLGASQSYYTLNKCPPMLDLSLEIFDDVQYIASPVPTPNSAEENKQTSQIKCSHNGENKYFGDYERDPMYMENIKAAHGSKLYQPLEITAMDPISAYEHYSKTKCSPTVH